MEEVIRIVDTAEPLTAQELNDMERIREAGKQYYAAHEAYMARHQ